jgi:large subunit ribosomal protein L23
MESKFRLQPVISEKSYSLANSANKYTFWVLGKATKIDIRKDVETKYKVKVESVKVLAKPGKMKRDLVSYRFFRAEDGKKAIVQLKKGDKIDEFLNA